MVKTEGVSLFSQQHKPSEIKSLKNAKSCYRPDFQFFIIFVKVTEAGQVRSWGQDGRGEPHIWRALVEKTCESDGKTLIQVCECITNGESCLTDTKTASVPGKAVTLGQKSQFYSLLSSWPCSTSPLSVLIPLENCQVILPYQSHTVQHLFPPKCHLCLFLLYI